MDMQVAANIKSAELQAVIIRADGTRVELGTIAYFHKNPLKRMLWKLKVVLGMKTPAQ